MRLERCGDRLGLMLQFRHLRVSVSSWVGAREFCDPREGTRGRDRNGRLSLPCARIQIDRLAFSIDLGSENELNAQQLDSAPI